MVWRIPWASAAILRASADGLLIVGVVLSLTEPAELEVIGDDGVA